MRARHIGDVIVAIACAAPGAALADGAGDPEPEPEIAGSWSWQLGGDASAAQSFEDAGAGERAGERAAEIGATLQARYEVEGACDLLDGRQDLRWRWQDGESTWAPDGSMEICVENRQIPEQPWVPRILAGYDVRIEARPRLDAPPTLARGNYTLYGAHFDFAPIDHDRPTTRVIAAQLGLRADLVLQGSAATVSEPTRGIAELSFVGATVVLGGDSEQALAGDTARPLTIDAGAVRLQAVSGRQPDTLVVTATPVSITDLRAGRLLLGASAGYAYARWPDRSIHTAIGEARAETGLGPAVASLRYSRGALPAIDEPLVIEDRGTGQIEVPLAGGTLAASAFAALARSLAADAEMDSRDLAAGGALDYARPFGRFVTWRTTAELARSHYARIEPADAPAGDLAPRPVARVTTGLDVALGW